MLHSLYPAYTGLNRVTDRGTERTPNELKGAQISLPMQTDFVLEITANKALHRARLEGDAGSERWEIEINTEASSGSTARRGFAPNMT